MILAFMATGSALIAGGHGGPAGERRRAIFPELTLTPPRGEVVLMNESSNSPTSRREFIKTTGRLAAASALAGVALPHVHAAGSSLIQIALIGCGGRGTGAAKDAVSAQGGPVKLVAMADVFENRLRDSYDGLVR